MEAVLADKRRPRQRERPQRVLPSPLQRRVRRWLQTWSSLWGDGNRLDDVSIEVSPRIKHSWARAYPKTRRLVLSPSTLESSPQLLRAVVCHEAAHLFLAHGPPHGSSWRRLVEAAGELAAVAIPDPAAERRRRSPATWIHRCPVCQMSRVARRHVPQWRCATCVASGLPGLLVAQRAHVDS